jgi:hypothetical protein
MGGEKVKAEFIMASMYGDVVKSNTFETNLGKYAIDIIVYEGAFYFYKTKNGKIVECINLSEKAKEVKR